MGLVNAHLFLNTVTINNRRENNADESAAEIGLYPLCLDLSSRLAANMILVNFT